MKAITLTAIATTAASANVPQALLNLKNTNLLSADQEVSKLESIAHIATFDEIPIFGGQELREQMLQASNSPASTLDLAVNGVFTTFARVGCNMQLAASKTYNFVLKGDSRLTYGSFCEEIPTQNASLMEGHETDLAAALQ